MASPQGDEGDVATGCHAVPADAGLVSLAQQETAGPEPGLARRGRYAPRVPGRSRPWRIPARLKPYLFISPAVLLFVAFVAIPFVGIIALSFLQWDLLTPAKYAGTSNYRMLVHDPQVGRALLNSFVFDILTTTLHVCLGMALAIAVTSVRSKAVRYWVRTAFVAPFLMSAGAVALMWSYILSADTGPFNYYLRLIGLSPPNWLGSSTWALPSLVGVDLWQTLGFTFIIFLVGLQTIPSQLYEAAAIDGAGPFSRFRHITLPMLSPATLVVSVTAFIGAFEVFTWPYVLTSGGPGNATLTIMLYIYQVSFRNFQLGYGAAISIVNVAALLIFVVGMLLLARRWVHYERV